MRRVALWLSTAPMLAVLGLSGCDGDLRDVACPAAGKLLCGDLIGAGQLPPPPPPPPPTRLSL